MSRAKAFACYIVVSPVGFHWWKQLATPLFQRKGWVLINPEDFSYESSYGFDPNVFPAPNQISQIEYALRVSTAVVEYRGEPIFDSAFEPGSNYTVIDDLLAFMSLYTGMYWQYMWREYGSSKINWKGSFARQGSYHSGLGEQAGERDVAVSFFEKALASALPVEAVPVTARGTVAATALDLAKNTGQKIIFAGLDLASCDVFTHVRPHAFDTLVENTRLQ